MPVIKTWNEVVCDRLKEMFTQYESIQQQWREPIQNFRRLYNIESDEIILTSTYFGFVANESDIANFKRYITIRQNIGYSVCWFNGNSRMSKVWKNGTKTTKHPLPRYDESEIRAPHRIEKTKVYKINDTYYVQKTYRGRYKCPEPHKGMIEVTMENDTVKDIYAGIIKPIEIIKVSKDARAL